MDLEAFEAAIDANDPTIAPSMLYAYAALLEGVPFANGAPNLTVDIPALRQFATDHNVPISRQGLQDRPDADQDGARADAQGAHARPRRLVLDEHPRQPRRRGARRPGELQDQGGVEARRARAHPPAGASTPSSTATSTTRCGSTTTRRAATTRRAGTTSTSSAGSATRCRSRSTSCAATRSSPRRSRSTSCCSSTSPSAPAWAASRSG